MAGLLCVGADFGGAGNSRMESHTAPCRCCRHGPLARVCAPEQPRRPPLKCNPSRPVPPLVQRRAEEGALQQASVDASYRELAQLLQAERERIADLQVPLAARPPAAPARRAACRAAPQRPALSPAVSGSLQKQIAASSWLAPCQGFWLGTLAARSMRRGRPGFVSARVDPRSTPCLPHRQPPVLPARPPPCSGRPSRRRRSAPTPMPASKRCRGSWTRSGRALPASRWVQLGSCTFECFWDSRSYTCSR